MWDLSKFCGPIFNFFLSVLSIEPSTLLVLHVLSHRVSFNPNNNLGIKVVFSSDFTDEEMLSNSSNLPKVTVKSPVSVYNEVQETRYIKKLFFF